MHEWGQTHDTDFGTGMYLWPLDNVIHYMLVGGLNIPNHYYYYNIMWFYMPTAGYDGDAAWKSLKFPWTVPWYNSFRWDQNY